MPVDLTITKKIIETTSANDVNAYLNLGYLLIDTAKGNWDDSGAPYFKYSLAWTLFTDAPKLPNTFM